MAGSGSDLFEILQRPFLETLSQTTKIVNQDSRRTVGDQNRIPNPQGRVQTSALCRAEEGK
jgi:hypothetical protein